MFIEYIIRLIVSAIIYFLFDKHITSRLKESEEERPEHLVFATDIFPLEKGGNKIFNFLALRILTKNEQQIFRGIWATVCKTDSNAASQLSNRKALVFRMILIASVLYNTIYVIALFLSIVLGSFSYISGFAIITLLLTVFLSIGLRKLKNSFHTQNDIELKVVSSDTDFYYLDRYYWIPLVVISTVEYRSLKAFLRLLLGKNSQG